MTSFTAIRDAGLKLNLEKCHFCLRQLKFLGHVVGQDGILPDESKLTSIKDFPTPQNIRQVCGFMGLCSYYRKFIQDFSKKAKPLNQLLQKDVAFDWGQEQEHAFQLLKQHLVSSPIIAYPDFSKPFVVYTDASGLGFEAVLQQLGEDGKEHVIATRLNKITLLQN